MATTPWKEEISIPTEWNNPFSLAIILGETHPLPPPPPYSE